MARTQVQSELLAVNSISGTIIADNAITATHIATNAISGTLVQDGGIVTVMIAANNVTATKIVTDAVQTRHIADDQVTEAKLANAINTSIAAKLPLAGGTMTGNLAMGSNNITSSGTITGTIATAAQTNITSVGTLTALTVDDITINGSTISDASHLTIDAEGVIKLDANGGEIQFLDGGTEIGVISMGSQNINIESKVADKDIVFKGIDGSSDVTALTLDMSNAGRAIFNAGGTFNDHVYFGDNNKLVLGGGDDLQIYHDGSDSIIKDSGTGNLLIQYSDLYFSKDAGSTHSVVFRSTGNVGIGTTSPAARLHVKSSGATTEKAFHVSDSNGNDIFTVQGGGRAALRYYPFIIGNDSGHSLASGTRFFIDGSSVDTYVEGTGRWAIGETTNVANAYLTVSSNNGEGLVVGRAGSNAYRNYRHVTSSGIHQFISSANTATLTNAGAWENASDVAYKEDIQDLSYGLDAVKALRPRKYKMKGTDLGDGKGLDQQIGFIAQEVELLIPEVVGGEEGEKTLGYGVLTAVLVKAIQELEARVKELEG